MRDGGLSDVEARRTATTDLERNLVVVAGAGTGKTSLLVERVLVAVGTGHLRLVDLGAITFTEKAAGEMRVRIASGLEELRAGAAAERDPPGSSEAGRALATLRERGTDPREIARRATDALVELDHATVDTIHGFSSTLLRSHPVEAGVDPRFGIDGGERAASIRREVWDEFLARELGPGAKRAAAWTAALARLRLSDIRAVAFGLADFGVSLELLEPGSHAPAAEEILGPSAKGAVADLDDLLARARGLTPVPRAYLAGLRDALRTFVDRGLDALRELLVREIDLASRLDKRPTIPHKTKLEGVERVEVNERMAAATRLVRSLRDLDDARAALVFDLVLPYARQAREAMLRRGILTFDGLLALARDLLRDHVAVRRAARDRFRMLLVDEMQDTDPRQYEIILLLAAPDGCDTSDPLAIAPEPGRLFLVGDPKQSIYRFRGADFGSYRVATEQVLRTGGAALTLGANFRSVPAILEPVNRLFASAAWRRGVDERHQPDYAPIDAARASSEAAPCVEVWSVRGRGTRRDEEGAVLATEIRSAVASGRVPYRGITILFRALTTVSHYLRPLRQLGIPFVVDGGREFLRRPEVGHLLAALRTIAQPGDETALLAFLRSPAGGVSDVELADFVATDGRWDWRREVDRALSPRIAACFERLRRLAAEVRSEPADTVVRRVLARTGLLPLGAAGFEGAQRVVNLRKLAAAAADLARDSALSFDEILEAVEEGALLDLVSDAPLVDDSVDAVRITSIHKMKGLESDWVFLPDIARGERRDEKSPVLARAIRTPEGREVVALQVADVLNAAAAYWRIENERHEAAEEVRVLYVALTRARERLVLIAGMPSKQATVPWLEALQAWGYDAASPPEDGALLSDGLVLHRTIEAIPGIARDEEPHLPEGTREARRRHDLAVDRLRAVAPPFVAPSEIGDEAEAPRSPREHRADRDQARIVGIVVHRSLERYRGEPKAESLAQLAGLCREAARDSGCDGEAVERDARSIVETVFDSGLASRLSRLDVLGKEVPVLAATDAGPVMRGTIDLLARDSDGHVLIVDYKTDRETEPKELLRIHGPQLEAYARAVREALGSEQAPRAEIWALRAGTVVPVPVPQSPGRTTKR